MPRDTEPVLAREFLPFVVVVMAAAAATFGVPGAVLVALESFTVVDGGEANVSSTTTLAAVSAIEPPSTDPFSRAPSASAATTSLMRFSFGSGILNDTSLRFAHGKNSASNSMLPVNSRSNGSTQRRGKTR